jgi:hypothetical protein
LIGPRCLNPFTSKLYLIACRDPGKIPTERLFELEKKLYLIDIRVEGLENLGHGASHGGDDGKDDDEGDNSDDNYDDLEDEQDQMEMDRKSDSLSKTLAGTVTQTKASVLGKSVGASVVYEAGLVFGNIMDTNLSHGQRMDGDASNLSKVQVLLGTQSQSDECAHIDHTTKCPRSVRGDKDVGVEEMPEQLDQPEGDSSSEQQNNGLSSCTLRLIHFRG